MIYSLSNNEVVMTLSDLQGHARNEGLWKWHFCVHVCSS